MSATTPPENPVTLRVAGVPEHFNYPWHAALAEGAFRALGLNVVFTEVAEGTGAMCEAVRRGTQDVAVVLTEGAVADVIREGGTRLIAAYVDSPLTWGVHVGADQPLNDVSELSRGRFAISRFGSGSHLMTTWLAKTQGWSQADISYQPVGGLDPLVQAVVSGDSQAFLWEVFTTKPRVDSGELRRIGEVPTPWPCFVIIASETMLASAPRALRSLLTVVQRYCGIAMASPDAARAAIARRYHLASTDVARWFEGVRWSTTGALDTAVLEQVMDALEATGRIDGPVPAASLVASLDV